MAEIPDTIIWTGLFLIGLIVFGVAVHLNIINLFKSPREIRPQFGMVWKGLYADGVETEVTGYQHTQGKLLVKTRMHPKGRVYRKGLDVDIDFPGDGLQVWRFNKTSDGLIYQVGKILNHRRISNEDVDLDKINQRLALQEMQEAKNLERDKRINKSPTDILQLNRSNEWVKSGYDFFSKFGKWELGGDASGKNKSSGNTTQSGFQDNEGTPTNNEHSK